MTSRPPMHRPPQRGPVRGFTLVEMMTVVILVGVLATLAVYGVRKYIQSAKSSEAVSILTSIKAAEEAFKDETYIYLDVSGTGSLASSKFYPSATPTGKLKTQWGGAGADPLVAKNFKTLGIQADAPVIFGYAVVACGPGGHCTEFPSLPTTKTASEFGLPSAENRWGYVAVAKCDINGDGGKETLVLSHSYSTEVYTENEGE